MKEHVDFFSKLYATDVSSKVRQKNGLSYLSHASAWAEVKKVDPDATYEVKREVLSYDENGQPLKTRPWFDDGKSGWVEVAVTIGGLTQTEILPILDFKNKPMQAENITSADANKSIMRCMTKCCARHGLGLFVYEGEDIPEETKEKNTLQEQVLALIDKKCKNEKLKPKVAEICKAADPDGIGDPRNITDNAVLKELKTNLMKLR